MAKAKVELDARPRRDDPHCERCPLSEKSATVCCPSVGQQHADLFLVGEALGANEEELGRPFVGDAGFKLNYLLAKSGIERREVRIGNCVRCRPPGNKTPSKKQLEACWPYLLHDILAGKPKVIVALGATAINSLLTPPRRNVDKWRGFPERVTFRHETKKGKVYAHTCWVMPAYHPAANLHDWRHDAKSVRDLKAAKRYAQGQEIYKWPNTEVKVVKTFDEAIKLLSHLKRVGKFVLDLETSGRDPHKAKILCVGLSWKSGHASVLPLLKQHCQPFWKTHEYHEIVELLTEVLVECTIYGQNIKFDCKFLRALTGLTNFKVGFDTMLAHHCVDENMPHNLTFLCQWYLKWLKYDSLMDQYQGRTDGYASVPDQVLWKYCGYDCDGTWRLRKVLIPLLRKEKTIEPYKIEMGLINALADVEYRGVRVDAELMAKLSLKYRKEQERALAYFERLALKKLGQARIDKLPNKRFNPNSTKQLAMLLQVCGATLVKKTRGGNVSVDKNVLAALALTPGVPGTIARKQQDVRRLVKYISTYLDGKDGTGGFKQWISTKSRIHASYNVALSRTGRLSADDPPIQTIPRIGGLRAMFLPDQPEHVFLSVDYEKIELCVMAWLANDEVMARELINRVDLHSRMAITKRLNRDPTDEEFEEMLPTVSKQERGLAKGVNFGIPYGIGDAAIVEANPDAFPPKMRKQERKAIVRKIMDAYFEKYWGVREYREKQVRIVHKQGLIRTHIGRKRRLPAVEWFNSRYGLETDKRDLDLGHLEREAMNSSVQSFASDLLSKATKRVYDGMRRTNIPGLRTVMTLHDQLVFNVHREYVEDAIPLVKHWMESELPRDKRHKYEMPIRVDVNVQRFWGESEYE